MLLGLRERVSAEQSVYQGDKIPFVAYIIFIISHRENP